MSLRIGIDARLTTKGLGIAQFITNLTEQIAPLEEVVWFGDRRRAPRDVAEVRSLEGLPYPALDSAYGRRLVARERLDLFHFTSNTGWSRPGPVPFVLTVHDLIFFDTSLRHRRPRQIIGHHYMRWNVPRAARKAAAVITVSQASADALRLRLPDVDVTTIIPNATHFSPMESSSKEKYESALVFSASDPRKNLELAYLGWVAAGRIPGQLQVLGGAGIPERFRLLAADDLSSGCVVILPYLDRESLDDTLRRAGVLIYPSADEGFGLPVLEAMAAGTPVITGLAPATLELGKDAVARIDPADPVGSIASLLQRMQIDSEWRTQLRAAGLRRARAYSWSKSAERYLAVYESVLSCA